MTKALGERLHDIHFWKSELEREINDMIGETDLLLAQKKRLDHALLATEIPMHIATDNLNCRQRRQGIDLVQDEVELALLKVCLVYVDASKISSFGHFLFILLEKLMKVENLQVSCFSMQEVEIINNVQDLLRKTIKEAEKQIK